MERLHSQMIAWILSDDCDAFSPDSRCSLLAGLCGVPVTELGRVRRCQTEWEHLDVVIETEKSVVFIENKIKSSQSHGQLERYDGVIDKAGILEGRRAQRLLLSLVGERATASEWRNVTYGRLADRLASIPFAAGSNEDAAIVRAYLAALKRLVEVVQRFLDHPERFGNVFREGSLSRARKSGLPLEESLDWPQYVRDLQLETVLQRLYLQEIVNHLAPEAPLVVIGETRGVALLDIKMPRALEAVTEGGHTFQWGIQFQGHSLKIQLESGYDEQGNLMPASGEMSEYLRHVVFDRVRDFVDRPQLRKVWGFNPPRGSGTAYCSISKPGGLPCWGGPLAEAVESYRAALAEALAVAAGLRDHLGQTSPDDRQ